MWVLLFTAIFLRVLAVGTFLFWEYRSHRLVERQTSTPYTKRSGGRRKDVASPPPAVGATVTATSVFGMATVYDGSDDDGDGDVSGRGTSRGIEMQSLLA